MVVNASVYKRLLWRQVKLENIKECYLNQNLLLCAVDFDSIPVYEIRSVRMNKSTKCFAVAPWRGHVGDGDSWVGVENQTTPFLQSLASWHGHVDCHRSHHRLSVTVASLPEPESSSVYFAPLTPMQLRCQINTITTPGTLQIRLARGWS